MYVEYYNYGVIKSKEVFTLYLLTDVMLMLTTLRIYINNSSLVCVPLVGYTKLYPTHIKQLLGK